MKLKAFLKLVKKCPPSSVSMSYYKKEFSSPRGFSKDCFVFRLFVYPKGGILCSLLVCPHVLSWCDKPAFITRSLYDLFHSECIVNSAWHPWVVWCIICNRKKSTLYTQVKGIFPFVNSFLSNYSTKKIDYLLKFKVL